MTYLLDLIRAAEALSMVNAKERDDFAFELAQWREDEAVVRTQEDRDLTQASIQAWLDEGESYDLGSGHVRTEVHTPTGTYTHVRLVNDGGPVPAMIEELCQTVFDDKDRGTPYTKAFVGPKDRDRTREIGKHLNDLGGVELMQAVHRMVALMTANTDLHGNRMWISMGRGLETAWDDIGTWRC